MHAQRALAGARRITTVCLFAATFTHALSAQSLAPATEHRDRAAVPSLAAAVSARRDVGLARVPAPQSGAATATRKGGSKLKWILIAAGAAGGGAAAFMLSRGSDGSDAPTVTVGPPVVGAP